MPKITVKTRRLERFRRAGLEFNRAGVELDTDELSEAQLAAIKAEPNLLVAEGETEAGTQDEKPKEPKRQAADKKPAPAKEQGK